MRDISLGKRKINREKRMYFIKNSQIILKHCTNN